MLTTILLNAGTAMAYIGFGWLIRHVTTPAAGTPASPIPAVPTTPATPTNTTTGLVGSALQQLEEKFITDARDALTNFFAQVAKGGPVLPPVQAPTQTTTK